MTELHWWSSWQSFCNQSAMVLSLPCNQVWCRDSQISARCDSSSGTMSLCWSHRISDLLSQQLSALSSSTDQAGRVSLTWNPLPSVTYWCLTISFKSSQLVFHLILPFFFSLPQSETKLIFLNFKSIIRSQMLCSASILPFVWEHMAGITTGASGAGKCLWLSDSQERKR